MFRSRFRKKPKGCPSKTHRDFCSASCKCPMTFKKYQNLRTYAKVYGFILVQCRYLAASTFFITRGSKSREAPQTYVLKSSISSAFSDKLTIVCSFDSLVLLGQREGEEREIRKLQEAMRPFSNNNTERPSEMLECICRRKLCHGGRSKLRLPFAITIFL